MTPNEIHDVDLNGILPQEDVQEPNYNVRALYEYCRQNNIPLADITDSIIDQFAS